MGVGSSRQHAYRLEGSHAIRTSGPYVDRVPDAEYIGVLGGEKTHHDILYVEARSPSCGQVQVCCTSQWDRPKQRRAREI